MNLDLDIKNYKVKDLENFFKLPINYTPYQFTTQVKETYDKINSSELNEDLKQKVLEFIKQAKNTLSQQQPKVEKPPIQYTSAKLEDFVEGQMNPIEKRSTTKTICIDTLFRPNYSKTKSTDFLYVLPMNLNKVVSMQMSSLEIPNMWNSISAINKSNTFEIELFNVNTGTAIVDSSCIIVIPEGNYMADTFQSTVNNIFQSYTTPGLNFLNLEICIQTNTIIRTNVFNYDVIGHFPYNPLSQYYSPNFYFKLNFAIPNQKLYKTVGWMMGFRQESYTVTQPYTSYADTNAPLIYNNYIKSESSYGSMIDNYIFLEVNDFHNNFPTDLIVSTNETSYLGNNILARIVLMSGANTIVWNNAGDLIFKKREYFGPIKLEKIHIRILNRFGDVLDLRGNDFSFVLEIKQLY